MKKLNWFRRKVERRRNSTTAKPRQRRLLCEILEQRALMAAYITEVNPTGSSSAYAADWFEVTNTGPGALDITGWKVDDNSNLFSSAVAVRGVTSIAAGQSMIFFEGNATGTTDASIVTAFNNAWGTSFVFGVDIGAYGGSGIGLSGSGDALNLYSSTGTLQANVTFGAATTGKTFDNAANLNDTAISQLSAVGANGAFVSTIGETGSPGISLVNAAPVFTSGSSVSVSEANTNGVTGPSTSVSPYLTSTNGEVQLTSVLTVGDSVGGYRMVGIPDGMGAYDNNDGTFTLLMNHEIANNLGVARAHGQPGAFVSAWVINKSTLQVVSIRDFLQNGTSVYLSDNNQSAGTVHSAYLAAATTVFGRLCSADLAAPTAYLWDDGLGTVYGTSARIFQSGEESGGSVTGVGPEATTLFGRQFAFVATDDPNTVLNEANTAWELPHGGLFAWENNLANPLSQRKTIVMGMDDTSPSGQVYVWVGDKQTTGNVVERAGLTKQSANDNLYVVKVAGLTADGTGATNEDRNTPLGGTFTLENEGDVSGLTGSALEALSDSKGGTQFLRPEDGQWDPNNPSDFYFVTTDRYDQTKDGVGSTVGRSRLYKLHFTDIANPELGGTITCLLDGTEAGNMFDNMTVADGKVLLQEDAGNVGHLGKVWSYDIATDVLTQLAQHDRARFGDVGVNPLAPFSIDEENSGVIDVSAILGAGTFLLNVQAHYNAGDAELVEGGQLLMMRTNVASGTQYVTTVAATDAESNSLTFAISGGNDAGDFTINSTTGELRFATAPNFESPADSDANNAYTVEVSVSDGINTAVKQTITVTVTSVNEAPTNTTAATINVPENTTAVTTATGVDPEGAALTFAISGGADAAKFSIVPGTGVLSFLTPPNFDSPTDNGANNSYFVTLTVSDGVNPPVNKNLVVNVVNMSETVDLSSYVRVGRYDLPEPTRTTAPANSVLAQEVSAVTYNWDTDTLFVVGDGGTSVVQVSKTGQLINSMTLATGGSPQGTEFYDPEGLVYVGNGQFVMTEERDRTLVLFTYAANTTLTRGAAQTVKLGTFVQNIGLEGLSYDPLTGGFIVVKETQPQGIFQTEVDFDAVTATNGSPTTENSTNMFDPTLLNLLDLADVFALSNLPYLNGKTQFNNLLVLSQESGKILNIDRSGNIHSSLTIQNDPGNPLSVPAHQHEGLTMDGNGYLYVVSENGGGDFDHPQLWVYALSPTPNAAPTGLALNNQVNAIDENTSTTTRIKVADVVITDDGIGTNNFTVSGTDAAFFEVDSNGLYIKAGTTLDFETKSSYSVTVNVDDPSLGATPDATANFTLNVTDLVNENPNQASLFISEVAPWSSGNSPFNADWFEVTNTGSSAINITGWKFDDSSGSFASAVALSGITSIAAGESVIFIESADLTAASAAFRNTWFGGNAPAGLQIGNYTGGGVGLSTGGDAVNLYNSSGVLQTGITFGTSPAGPSFPTFNNAAAANNSAVSQLSAVGVNGAFAAVNDANEIGSPGTVGRLFISEVAPWSSSSPVGADWFEVTNTTAFAIDITGWKFDDSSGSFAASVALSGITSIAAGESVIFLETSNLTAAAATFRSTWFGANAPVGLQIGGYTGSGVGLSTGGDAVHLYNSTGLLQASVSFGTSPTGPSLPTFNNAAALNGTAVSQLSSVGVNGAFAAVNDTNEIGSPGTILTVDVNDPPVHSVPSTQAANSGTPLTFNTANGNKISIADPDAGMGFLQVTLTGVGGTLTLSTTAGLSFSSGGSGTASMTFTGTLSAVNAALDGMTFAANAGFSGAGSLRIETSDQGNTGGSAQTDDDTITINVNAAPTIVGVYARGSDWSGTFTTYLANNNLGDATLGYELSNGSNQLRTLPWSNVNTVSIMFTEGVTIGQSDLTVVGSSNGPTVPSVSGFSWNATTFVATWTFDAALPADKYLLHFGNTVLDAGGASLDGEWTTSSSTDSGNGTAGGDFNFRFNVLAGDFDGSNAVTFGEIGQQRLKVGRNTGSGDYNYRQDYDGSGALTFGEVGQARLRVGTGMSTFNEPVAPGAGPLTVAEFAPLSILDGNAEFVSPFARLTADELAPLVREALARLQATGLVPAGGLDPATLRFEIVDLGPAYLGLGSADGTILLDDDGAGWGWFVDVTPQSDEEFTPTATPEERTATVAGPAVGRMDLLTTVLHELGHRLGHADDAVTGTPIDVLMAERLPTGLRRTPGVPASPLSVVTTTDADLPPLKAAVEVPVEAAFEAAVAPVENGSSTTDMTPLTFTTTASPAPEHVALAAWTADADYGALALWAAGRSLTNSATTPWSAMPIPFGSSTQPAPSPASAPAAANAELRPEFAALALWADGETDAYSAATYSAAKLKPRATPELSSADDLAGTEVFGE